jgi:hypothetical protein
MRLVSLLVLAIAAASPAIAQDAPATSGVTILRGSSAPPPPPAQPAAPQTTVIQRETVYQPVYVDPYSYGYGGYGYGGVGAVVGPVRRAAPPAAPAQSNVPNGWPLVQGGRR